MSTTTFTVDATPDSHFVSSVMNTSISGPEAMSELIDNSLDAGASTVALVIGEESIECIDDGKGSSDLRQMIAWGKNETHATTRLGRYGVGLKNATCGIGDYLSIVTVHKEITREMDFCWSDLERDGWQSLKGRKREAIQDECGTKIVIGRLRHGVNAGPVKKAIAFNFAPALLGGKRITVDGEPIKPWLGPKQLTETIKATVWHEDIEGVGFRVTAGLSKRNDQDPFILAYQHRIIGGTSEPCGDYVASSRFLAYVELFGEWSLLKHKDGLTACVQAEWLYQQLAEICDPLLKKVHADNEDVRLQEVSAELTLAINASRKGKAKRPNRNGQHVVVTPSGTDRKVDEAEVVAGLGQVDERPVNHKPERGIRLAFSPLAPERIAKIQTNGKQAVVLLNDSHPWVLAAKKEPGWPSLKAAALAAFCDQQISHTDRATLFLNLGMEMEPKDKFILSYSKLLAALKISLLEPEPEPEPA
jgi:Histidine kinase-, DNA gyrase B-, and HSP90-like ATPase